MVAGTFYITKRGDLSSTSRITLGERIFYINLLDN